MYAKKSIRTNVVSLLKQNNKLTLNTTNSSHAVLHGLKCAILFSSNVLNITRFMCSDYNKAAKSKHIICNSFHSTHLLHELNVHVTFYLGNCSSH